MLKKIFLFLISASVLFCQNNTQTEKATYIKGTVTDATSNEAVEFASVYLSGTTIGTTTKKDGSFILKNDTVEKSILVVSSVGYKAEAKTINKTDEDTIFLKIQLTPIVYNLSAIDVEAKETGDWKSQYKYFIKLFLGNNSYADECTVVNPYILDFEDNEDSFTASCKERLTIINKMLGYKINCLVNFKKNKKTEVISQLTFSQFQELVPSTPDSVAIIKENRMRAYWGSLKHLLITLANPDKNSAKEDFKLSYIQPKSLYQSPFTERAKIEEVVYYDRLTGNFWLNPVLSQKTQINGIEVLYSGEGRRGVSQIMVKTSAGAEFDKRGNFLNPDSFVLYGEMANDAFSRSLPDNWNR